MTQHAPSARATSKAGALSVATEVGARRLGDTPPAHAPVARSNVPVARAAAHGSAGLSSGTRRGNAQGFCIL